MATGIRYEGGSGDRNSIYILHHIIIVVLIIRIIDWLLIVIINFDV